MDIRETPLPYVVVDDFYRNFKEISKISRDLFPYAKNGTNSGENYKGLYRKELYLYSEAEQAKYLIQEINDAFWNKCQIGIWDSLPMPFSLMTNTTKSDLLLGYYGLHDRYSLHHDVGFLTCITFVHEKHNFEGGELILTNMRKYHSQHKERQEVRIEAKPNRLVIFPSCYYHGVSRVHPHQNIHEDVNYMRISLTHFLTF